MPKTEQQGAQELAKTVAVDPKSQSPNLEFRDQNSGTFGKSEFQRESGQLAK